MSDAGLVIIAVFALILSGIVGAAMEQSSWKNDCSRAGVHVAGQTVYDCKERK